MKSESVKQWHRKGSHIYQQEGGYRFDIAEVFRDVGAMQAEANARIIAAAPELLEACKEARGALQDLKDSGDAQDWKSFRPLHEALKLANSAISKVEGNP